jgi:hypothetical protein
VKAGGRSLFFECGYQRQRNLLIPAKRDRISCNFSCVIVCEVKKEIHHKENRVLPILISALKNSISYIEDYSIEKDVDAQ